MFCKCGKMMLSDENGNEMLVYYSLGNYVNSTASEEPDIGKRMLGAMADYVSRGGIGDFAPMNANFGILPALNEKVRDKALKKRLQAERSLETVKQFVKENRI